MQDLRNSPAGEPLRRLVLGAALVVGLAAALIPDAARVRAADLAVAQAASPADKAAAGETPGQGAAPKAAPAAPTPPAASAPGKDAKDADADSDDSEDADADAQSDSKHGAEIVIEKGKKRVRIQGLGRDREYDSFEQFVDQAPWLAGLVFLTVMLVFLVPLLIIVLLIWYKIRKNRLANETMLKLAERGVVTPAAAMDAVASGNAASFAAAAGAAAPAGTASAPAYEHARLLQRHAVWSDLRKGVILTAVGVGLSAYSMFASGEPNGVGLILLFLGLGYCLLWFFEDRTSQPRGGTPGAPPAGSA